MVGVSCRFVVRDSAGRFRISSLHRIIHAPCKELLRLEEPGTQESCLNTCHNVWQSNTGKSKPEPTTIAPFTSWGQLRVLNLGPLAR